MKEFIKENKIGDIVSCRAQMNCWFPEIKGNWRQDKAKTGGGALIDMGISKEVEAEAFNLLAEISDVLIKPRKEQTENWRP